MSRALPLAGAPLAVVVTATLLSGEARADFDFQLSAHASGGWLRETPTLSARAVSTSARDISGGDVRTRGGIGMLGVGADLELTIDDRWRAPLLGGTAYWAVGSYDAAITSLDGSIVRLRPWSAFRGDLLLPGVGRRWKHRRFMWGAVVRTGVSFMGMGGTVAAGAEAVPLAVTTSTFLVQAELEACRRLDPTTRACVHVTPRVYEYELLNGVTFGLRMEWGP